MRRTFGAAADFYRARVIKIEESEPSELDWHDDVLFREPSYALKSKKSYRVESISLDTGDIATLGEFGTERQAESLLSAIVSDLEELTKLQFEKKYNLS
ncbi:MAG: hypothetical protein M1548_02785 [Actinobacteria bacterium]|nr:hypothetical protein [Actinomycetota bacterium]